MARVTRIEAGALALGVVLLTVLPFALSGFRTLQLATVGAYLVAVLGLDVLLSCAGRLSLGHGAFMALGAYTTAILTAHHGVRDVWTIPVAAAVAGAAGLAAGIPAMRLRGPAFALVTFGLAIALPAALEQFDRFTGGAAGISLGTRGHGDARYALTWTLALALFAAAWALLGSRFGRELRAIRDNELAARAAGVDRFARSVVAFGVSAAFAGVAGALLAIDAGSVGPGTFPVTRSLTLVAAAVVGAYGSIWGAVVGAVLVEYLPDVVGALPHVGARQAGPATFVFGAAVIVLVLLRPLVVRLGTLLADRSYPRP